MPTSCLRICAKLHSGLSYYRYFYTTMPPYLPLLTSICINSSLRIWKLAYSEPVPKPGNGDGCGRNGIWRKNILGVHGCSYSHSHPCGCCRPASGHTVRGVSERGPVINQGPHQVQNQASTKEVRVLDLRSFMFLSAVSSRFSLVLDPRGRLAGLGGKVGKN